MRLPSGVNRKSETPSGCALIVRTRCAVCHRQTLIMPSSPPETMNRRSADTAINWTMPLWAGNERTNRPVVRSQMPILPFAASDHKPAIRRDGQRQRIKAGLCHSADSPGRCDVPYLDALLDDDDDVAGEGATSPSLPMLAKSHFLSSDALKRAQEPSGRDLPKSRSSVPRATHEALRDQKSAVWRKREIIDLACVRCERNDLDGSVRLSAQRFSGRCTDRKECQQSKEWNNVTWAHVLPPWPSQPGSVPEIGRMTQPGIIVIITRSGHRSGRPRLIEHIGRQMLCEKPNC